MEVTFGGKTSFTYPIISRVFHVLGENPLIFLGIGVFYAFVSFETARYQVLTFFQKNGHRRKILLRMPRFRPDIGAIVLQPGGIEADGIAILRYRSPFQADNERKSVVASTENGEPH